MIEQRRIEELIAQELEDANKKYPLFHSPHEAYAVLYEETDELGFEVDDIRTYMGRVWEEVKGDTSIARNIERIRRRAIFTIQEAIQVAAMCDKIKQSGLY